MYTVTCDENIIFDLKTGFNLISPVLNLEDSAPGTFSFTISPDHPYYNDIIIMKSDISVRKNGAEIWSGRPITEEIDFYKQKKITCEGALAYLNDTIQPQKQYDVNKTTVRSFIESLLSNHNSKSSKKFSVGAVDVTDTDTTEGIYRYTNYETTLECINDKLLSRLDGHLRLRRISKDVWYVDYLKDYIKRSPQIIRFGTNLLDYSSNYDMTDIATAVIPLGEQLETSPIEALTAYLDITSVNSGNKDLKNTTAINNYGYICKVVHFDDITKPANLKKKGQEWLNKQQYDHMVLEIRAIDFNLVDSNMISIDLLDEVEVISEPHGLDLWFPVTKMQIPLADPGNATLTLGTDYSKSLSSKSAKASKDFSNYKYETITESNILKEAKENATQLILTGVGLGYVQTNQDEILIMDNADKNKAKKIWRWNLNGLGYSSTGYNGKYGTAITMNGAIVADYITTGQLNADLIKVGTLKDVKGNTTWDLNNGTITIKKGSINLGSGNFEVDNNGNVTARTFTANRYININATTSSTIKIPINTSESSSATDFGYSMFSNTGFFVKTGTYACHIGGEDSSLRVINNGIVLGRSVKRNGSDWVNKDSRYINISAERNQIEIYGSNSGAGVSIGTNTNDFIQVYNGYTNRFYVNSNGSGYFYQNLSVGGSLSVSGSKNRLVKTNDYGERLLYSYETPSPLFGDVGEGTIGEDGKCYVQIDSIFSETVALSQYQVFVQKYGNGDCYISERNGAYFIVEGTPGLKFGFEIKAKQLDFTQLRLEKNMEIIDIKKIRYDYATSFIEHMLDVKGK